MNTNICMILIISFMTIGCCCSKECLDDKYQPLGTCVITANGLLMVKYPKGIPDNYAGDEYKNLLLEDYKLMYERLQPYHVLIQRIDNNFITRIYDSDLLILSDWSCTEGRIDCWGYNSECNPDTIHVHCLQ